MAVARKECPPPPWLHVSCTVHAWISFARLWHCRCIHFPPTNCKLHWWQFGIQYQEHAIIIYRICDV